MVYHRDDVPFKIGGPKNQRGESHSATTQPHQHIKREGGGMQVTLLVVYSDIDWCCADLLCCAWESHPHFCLIHHPTIVDLSCPYQGIWKQRRERVSFGNKWTQSASGKGRGALDIVNYWVWHPSMLRLFALVCMGEPSTFLFDPLSNYCGSFLSISRDSKTAQRERERESHSAVNKPHQHQGRGRGAQHC